DRVGGVVGVVDDVAAVFVDADQVLFAVVVEVADGDVDKSADVVDEDGVADAGGGAVGDVVDVAGVFVEPDEFGLAVVVEVADGDAGVAAAALQEGGGGPG